MSAELRSKTTHQHLSGKYQVMVGLTAHKSILIWSAGIIGNLKTASAVQRIMIQVDVGSLVEAMVQRLDCGMTEVVVNVGEPLSVSQSPRYRRFAHTMCTA